MNEYLDAINNVGFPIAMVIILMYKIFMIDDKRDARDEKIAVAMDRIAQTIDRIEDQLRDK